MQYTTKYIRRIRELFIGLIEELSIDQLNEIPEGFNNNIVWNFGHLITSTTALCYISSGVDKDADNPYFSKYRKGTKPEGFVTAEEVNDLKKLAFTNLDKIESDLAANKFQQVQPFATGTFKYEMHSIEEILTCATAHESFHLGISNAMKKLVTSDHYQQSSVSN